MLTGWLCDVCGVLWCVVQWEVYASKERGHGGGWNEKRAELAGQTAGGKQVVVQYGDTYYLAILSSNGNSGQLTVYETDGMLGELTLVNYTAPLPPTVPSAISSFHALHSHLLSSFVVITSNQSLSLYLTPTLHSWQQLTAHRSFTLTGKGSDDVKTGSFAYSVVVWESATISTVVAGQVSISRDGGRLYVNVFSVRLDNATNAVNLIASAVIQPSQLHSFSINRPHSSAVNVTAAAIALTVDDVKRTCPSGAQPYDMAGVLSFTTADYDAYMAVVCVSLKGALYVSSPVLFDVGASPSLSIATSPPSTPHPPAAHVLLTLSDSYCYNNEPANKFAYSGLCDHTPTPLTDVLTYTYARLVDIALFVHQAAANNSTAVQPSVICSPLLLHGMFDMGSRSSVLLWTGRDDSGQQRLGVVELHVGRHDSDRARVAGGVVAGSGVGRGVQVGSNGVCGVSEPFDGLVIDAWQLPQRTTWRD